MCTEKTEPLGNGINIFVSDIHKFNTDTILLADFSRPKKHEKAIDLGTGCGTIPLIWCRDNPLVHIHAVDIQKDACDLLNKSVELNNLQEKITVINDDMQALCTPKYLGSFDLAVCNPPYKREGSGLVNPHIGKKTARHETELTLDGIAMCAKRLLRFGGRFCLCQRAERLSDVIEAFRKAEIEPKRLRFVQQRHDKPPKFFLIEGKNGAFKGGLNVMPTLFIEGDDGDFSEEMKNIYGIYKSYKYN